MGRLTSNQIHVSFSNENGLYILKETGVDSANFIAEFVNPGNAKAWKRGTPEVGETWVVALLSTAWETVKLVSLAE